MNLRTILRWVSLSFSLLLVGLLSAGFSIFQTASTAVAPQNTPAILPIGAGGLVSDIDVQGTDAVIRTDTYGGYVLVNSSSPTCGNNSQSQCWVQLVTYDTMPEGSVTQFSAAGISEIRMAPSNHDRCYMLFGNGTNAVKLYRTDNCRANSGGVSTATWTLKSAFTGITFDPNAGTKLSGPYMGIHPTNPDEFIIGSLTSAAQYSTDGGATINTIGSVAAPGSSLGSWPAYNPATPNTVYLAVYGTGVYRSTTGASGTFSLLNSAGMPTTFQGHVSVDASGNFWGCDATAPNSNVHKYNGSAWSAPTLTRSYQNVAIRPSDSNIFLAVGSELAQSTNGGSTFTEPFFNTTYAASDIPWLSTTVNGGIVIDIKFDTNSRMFGNAGAGVFVTSTPTPNGNVWTSLSARIEQMVGHWIVSPWDAAAVPLVAFWDRQVFRITSVTQYPSTFGCVSGGRGDIVGGWAVDWASSSPLFTAAICNSNIGQGEFTGKSTDNGVTWSSFTTEPTNAASVSGGQLAVSTPSIIVWVLGQGGQLWETTNGGTTWSVPSISGVASSGNAGWDVNNGSFPNTRQIVCADRNGPSSNGVIYAYNGGSNVQSSTSTAGIYKRAAAGTWTRALTGHIDGNDNTDAQMRCVPGVSGEMFYTSGIISNPHPVAQSFYDCTDVSGTITCSPVSGIKEVIGFGFGKAKPAGSGFPAIFIWGYTATAATFTNGQASITSTNTYAVNDPVSFSTSGGLPTNFATGTTYYVLATGLSGSAFQVGATKGGTPIVAGSAGSGSQTVNASCICRSDDHAATWKRLNNGQQPGGNVDVPTTVEGDANIFGRVYWCFGGSSCGYQDSSWLLKRDIDPGLNDNGPMWLEKAA